MTLGVEITVGCLMSGSARNTSPQSKGANLTLKTFKVQKYQCYIPFRNTPWISIYLLCTINVTSPYCGNMQHIRVSLILLKPATCIHIRVSPSTHRPNTCRCGSKSTRLGAKSGRAEISRNGLGIWPRQCAVHGLDEDLKRISGFDVL